MKKEDIAVTAIGAIVGRSLASQTIDGILWIRGFLGNWHSYPPTAYSHWAGEMLKPFAGHDPLEITPMGNIRDMARDPSDLTAPLRIFEWAGCIAIADLLIGATSRFVATNPRIHPLIRQFEQRHSSYLSCLAGGTVDNRQRFSRALLDTACGTVLYGALLTQCSNGNCG